MHLHHLVLLSKMGSNKSPQNWSYLVLLNHPCLIHFWGCPTHLSKFIPQFRKIISPFFYWPWIAINSLVGEIWLTNIHINIPLTYRSSLVPLLPTPPWPCFGWYRTRPACLRAGRSHCNHRPVMRTDAVWNFGSSYGKSIFGSATKMLCKPAKHTRPTLNHGDPLKFACCVPRNGVTLFVDQ